MNQVDFLDTAGDLSFPAMRRLSITNAQAFVLVYSINDPNSFEIVKSVFEEIREVRQDFQVRQFSSFCYVSFTSNIPIIAMTGHPHRLRGEQE
jgi:GTPase SAR1 family protein